ncbi:S-adenosyl-L-methionine-dependent tRNA 4-demethylwyosine synthase [Merluccius polli]|uniref:tRNA 4-demethylwyosine synthase (AdoMet-dependent) n=1 Tax=Merluccius polli TaxID=89951 RepID=A0AA47NV70_MERPO|nr:S-adenosyl-L-methionine-dependent tRNA 4-demethylwyosine synthase [Merluccius polli]
MWHGSWLIILWHCSTHVSSSDMTGGESEPSPLESCWVGLVWHHRLYLYGFLAAVFGTWLSLKMAFSKRSSCAEVVRQRRSGAVEDESSAAGSDPVSVQVSAVKILYGSQTGTAQGFAKELAEEVRSLGIAAEVIKLKDYDPDDRLSEECTNRSVCVFLLATYTDGQPTENADWFCKWLEDASTDFRYGKTYLKGLRYAVFGLGHSAYVGHYNTVSRNVDKWLWMLSGTRLLTRGSGDCNVAKSRSGSVQGDFLVWKVHFLSRLRALADRGETRCCSGDGGGCKSRGRVEEEEEEMLESSSDEESAGPGENKSVVDVEDLGDIMSGLKRTKSAGQSQAGGQMVRRSKSNGAMRKGEEEEERREMITPALRQALTKQGYKLIGSHSGVKLCRWTKSMLRGRGGCYKHTFYGIESHRCMETTPSLACANKCVFCWRHHTNPVGTEWRWKMDPAEKILQEALDNHQSMIRQFRVESKTTI